MLCTHIPPAIPQLLYDTVARRLERGSTAILEHIRRTQPRYALFGHVHQPLARRARMSDRSFARRFVAETGTTPHRWLTLQRVLCAQRLLEDTDLAVDDIAERCGFGAGALLRHHFRKVVGVSPADYRRTFRSAPCAPPVAAAATA